MKIKYRITAMALACSMSMPANAYFCGPFNDTLVVAEITAVETAMKAMWKSLFNTLSRNLLSWDQRELAAMRVVTSQVATAAKAQINANLMLKQGEMAAIGSLEATKQQLKVYQDFSALTGQGVDPCTQLAAQTNVTLANGQAVNIAAAAVAQAAAAPGRYSSAEGYMDRLLKIRQTTFATPDEEKLGFGKAATAEVVTSTGAKFALAGADTNAGVLFADSSDPRIKAAKDAYINHMGGAPDQPLTKDLANLPAGRDYLVRKGAKDAAMSAALNSLAMVGAEHTPVHGQDSKAQAMRNLVGQYYGKEAANRWKGWTSQSQRGVLVDQMKLDAALLAVKAEQYQSGQRLEVLMASLLTTSAQSQFKPALEQAAQSLESQRARPAVR